MLQLRTYRDLLAAQLHGLRGRVAWLGVVLLAGLLLQLVNPQLLRVVIDGALDGEPGDDLARVAAMFVAVAVGAQVLAVLAAWLAEDVGWRATNRLRDTLVEHVLDLDLGFHTEHSPGHLIERVDGDVTALANFFSAFVVKVLGSALLVLGIVVLVARESWLLGLVVLAQAVAFVAVFPRVHGVVVPWWRDVSETQARVSGTVGELVDGMEDVVPNGASAFAQEHFADGLRELLPRTVRGWTGYAVLWASNVVLSVLTTIGVYVLGARLVGAGELTVGSVFLVTYYVIMVDTPLHQLREQLTDLQKAGGAIARIGELRAATSSMPPPGDARLDAGRAHAVRLDGVRFAYGDGPDVLRDVDLDLPAGRVLGVVGRTGAGKSTLAKLLVRLHDPTNGAVTLDGVVLSQVADLRRHVAMVTQEVQLFRASVRDNVTLFDEVDTDDASVVSALGDVGLGDWFAALDDGLDTIVSADDVSAGQAQLLVMARVFLRDPGVVVLDEASSRLDPATEAALDHAMTRLLRGRTAVVIAHRLDTLRRVDDVLVLDRGRVVEHGSREALAADPTSRFSRLLATGMAEVLV